MSSAGKTKLYIEEFNMSFRGRGSGVRRALVISAFIEGQILSLARNFLEERGVEYKPEARQEYYQSLNTLKTNGILSPEDLREIQKFRTERNIAIHGIFKGMTRDKWNAQNEKVKKLGRPIIKKLDKKLFP